MLKLVLADPHAKALSKMEVEQLLARPNILRLAYLVNGLPKAHPVWYYYSKGKFFVAISINGAKAKALRKSPSVYFLVDENQDGPPRGVRGRGIAKVIEDSEYATRVTRRNVKRYLGTLTSAAAKMVLELAPESCVLEITPLYMATWKY